MKINNILLENFRIHKYLYVEFTDGINLILGPNGSGKSSIIEAIGITMFGMEPRTNLKDIIKNGAKFFHIKIEFTGNDNQVYIVERYFGNKNKYILVQRNNPAIYEENKDNILKKIRNLCGIPEGSNKIFKSVITAEQNKIIDIFLGTNKEKEKYFNEIFNTKIYRDLFEGFCKDAIGLYREKISRVEGEFELLKKEVEKIDIDNLKDNIKRIENNLKNLSTEKENLKIKKENLLRYIEGQENLSKELQNNRQNYEKTKELLKIHDDNLKKIIDEIGKIKESEKFINENENNYNKYIRLKSEIEHLDKEIDKKNKSKEKCIKLNDNKYLLKNSNNILLEKNKNFESNIENETLEVEKKKRELEELLDSKRILEEQIREFEIQFKKKEEKINEFNLLYEEYKSYVKNLDIIDADIFNFEKMSVDIDFLNSKLKELENKLSQVEEFEKKINLLEQDKKTILKLLKLNKEAHEKLEVGQCPYLNEKCLNLQNKDINRFFEYKEKKLKDELLVVNNTIEELNRKVFVKKDIEKNIEQLHNEIYSFAKEKKKYNISIGKRDLFNEKLENVKLRIINLLSLENKKDVNVDDLKIWLISERDKLQNIIKNKRESLEKVILDIEKKEREIGFKIEKVNDFKKQIENNMNELKNNEEEINKLKSTIQVLEDEIKDLPQLVERRNIMLEEKKNLENFYNDYIVHLSKVEKLKKVLEEKSKIEKSIEHERKKLYILGDKINELKKQFCPDELVKKKAEKDSVENKIIDIEKKISEYKKDLDYSLIEKDKYNRLVKDLNDFKREKIFLENKIDIAEEFRRNLDSIGKLVANAFLQHIEYRATENFQKITGRDEVIRWVNNMENEKDSYKVYLYDLNEDFYRDFEILSGGEQVAVALSLRFALTNFFSNANFSIFDEPTNNLDIERRKSLADNLGIILDSHQQSIIITHDETFKEMAQNIILLN